MSKWQGAGELSIAKIHAVTKKPITAFRTLGCVDVFDPQLVIEKGTPHYERCSGLGQLDYQADKTRSMTANLTFTEWNTKNIALMFAATIVPAGEADTEDEDETLPDDIAVGEFWHLGASGVLTRQNITNWQGLQDSATVPNTPTIDEDYTLDTKYGTIKFLEVESFTQPFIVQSGYGFQIKQGVAMFKAAADEYMVRLNSKNAATSGLTKGLAEFYIAKITPPSSIPMIGEDFASFSPVITFYADTNRDIDSDYGQFGRVLEEA